MKNKTLILFCFTVMFLLSNGCSRNYSNNDLEKWITNKENGLKKVIENEYFKIEVQYKSAEYMAAIENRATVLTKEELKTKKKENLQYFNIKLISKTGEEVLKTALAEEKDYQRRKNYYLNEFENELILIDGKDTLPCILYHFETSFGILSFNNISVAFENKNKAIQNKKIILLDRALGFGIQEFNFKKEDINDIPHLKTK